MRCECMTHELYTMVIRYKTRLINKYLFIYKSAAQVLSIAAKRYRCFSGAYTYSDASFEHLHRLNSSGAYVTKQNVP